MVGGSDDYIFFTSFSIECWKRLLTNHGQASGCRFVFHLGKTEYENGPLQARKKDFPIVGVTNHLYEFTHVLDLQQQVQYRKRAIE